MSQSKSSLRAAMQITARTLDECLASIFARPLRSALTSAGVAVGVASLIVTLGVSQSAGNQILSRVALLETTRVILQAPSAEEGGGFADLVTWNVEARLDRLNGVRASGALANVTPISGVVLTATVSSARPVAVTVPVFAASVGVLSAVDGRIGLGRWFSPPSIAGSGDLVAVLGVDAAGALGVHAVPGSTITMDGQVITVIGVLVESPGDPALLGAVLVSSSFAVDRMYAAQPERIIVRTFPGAAGAVAIEAPIALSPNAPDRVIASRPADNDAVQAKVSTDLDDLFLVLGLVSLLLGALSIVSVVFISVIERTGEFGLRRALGARRRHLLAQVLAESALLGLIGGVVGMAGGVFGVLVLARANDWTPGLSGWWLVASPVLGLAVGVLAGSYPSIRAARLEPVSALSRGV